MQVIISTENNAKVTAVKKVFLDVWPEIEFVTEKFPSNVSDQPTSEIEGVEGALNRAKNAQAKFPQADYCVGMEGYVDENKYGLFLAGAVAIIDKQGNIGIGFSAKMILPKLIESRIKSGKELGLVIKELMVDTADSIRQFDGTNGILSKGLYNRVDEFQDATKCALVKFVSPEIYNL